MASVTVTPEHTGGTDPERARAQAKQLCLRLLTAGPRSRAELARALAGKGFPPDAAEAALDRLAAARLVDDVDFAEQWVRSRHGRMGKGREVLAIELRDKGIDEEIISGALAGLTDEDERERGADLVRKKLRAMSVGDDRADRDRAMRRLVGMLARRGYPQSLAFTIVKEELSGQEFRAS
jgi:regulatory protein